MKGKYFPGEGIANLTHQKILSTTVVRVEWFDFVICLEFFPQYNFARLPQVRKKNILPLSLKLLVYPKSIKSNHDCFVFKTIEYETWASPKEIVVTPLYPGQRSVCF